MAGKKMSFGKVGYAAAGGIVAAIATKYIPFGGNYKSAIPLALGAVLMQQKGEAMQFAGAGMVGEGSAGLVTALVPALKISDDVTDEIYNRIMAERMAGDEDDMAGDNDIVPDDNMAGMYGEAQSTLMGPEAQSTLMGTENFNY
jgi:hypothetical protein